MARTVQVKEKLPRTAIRGSQDNPSTKESLMTKHNSKRAQSYAIRIVAALHAIIAITVFRPKLQELWDSIADGINAL